LPVLNDLFRQHTNDVVWLAAVGLVALVASLVLRHVILRQRERHPELTTVLRKTRDALITLVVVAIIRIGMFGVSTSDERWSDVVSHMLAIVFVIAMVWFACGVIFAVEGILLSRNAAAFGGDSVRGRKATTQIILLRRLLVAVVIVIGAGAILMTFPAVRVVGQSVLASAGLISIVAGLAAQTTLANVFAGIQLTITDSIRVGDVVEVEQESGIVGEITLTYVVVYLWDDRRLILPSSYFVTNPFENWTRWGDRITGVVTMDVDWTVPIADLRQELERVLDASPLWDHRSFSLVVGAVAQGNVTLRIATSAANTDDMFAVNALVRETVVTFLAARGEGLPRLRREDVVDVQRETDFAPADDDRARFIPD
jgi:small-conductance mechanosensitive channel